MGLVCSLANFTDDVTIRIEKVSNPSINTNSEGNTATLHIMEAMEADGGMYSCTASTATETSRVVFNLQVTTALEIIMPAADAKVDYRSNAQFSCIFSLEVEVFWFRNNSPWPLNQSSHYMFSGPGNRNLTIVSTTYRDLGNYTCRVLTNGIVFVEFSAKLNLTQPYMPLRSLGQSGQSLVVTLDRIKIECPVNGTPGPEIIYWQRVEADAENLTSREDSDNDPFVDEEGRLDFSEATVDDTGRYRCTAVDELGSREGHVFYVDVSHVAAFFLWTEWYMILVYCVVGVVILALVVMMLWFCSFTHFNWCVKVKKVVRERERVLKAAPLIIRTPVPRDEGIDAYALNDTEDKDGDLN